MAILLAMEKFSLTNEEGLSNYFNNLSNNNPTLFHFLIDEDSQINENVISAFKIACENYKINVFQSPSLVDMQVELTIGLEKEKISFSLSSIHYKVNNLWEACGYINSYSIPFQLNNNSNKSQIVENKNSKNEKDAIKLSITKDKKDKSLVFLFGIAFIWVLGASGILSIIRYIISPEIPTWIIYIILFVGFIIVWKLNFEKK